VSFTIPAGFDVDYYRASNPDLAAFSEDQAIDHYTRYGKREGRPPSPFALRENFLMLALKQGNVLEIGPFTNPAVRGRRVKYFDVLDRNALIERAKIHGYPIHDVPDIDYVSPIGDLAVVSEQFDAVVSSHAIEHQPDLIEHLLRVEHILKPGGPYFLLVPDKRYCFDHFIRESDLPEVLAAHHEKRRVHTLRSVIEHRAFITHNDAYRHWCGDHGEMSHVAERARIATNEWRQSCGDYIDVHAWQFTPDSFASIVKQLKKAKLVNLDLSLAFPTPIPRLEFCAILTRPHD
jgi:SAM-dependent methyltransferase